jgi:hypothetical protein
MKYQLGKVVWVEEILGSACEKVWRAMEELDEMGIEVNFAADEDR